MPPKSMSVIFILFTKGFILGILGCADGEVCSFRLLRVPAYKVPATCKVGAFYFFIKAVSVITVLVQKGAGKQNTVYPQYTVKFMQLFTLTQWATSGASWLVCCGSDLFRQKTFIFCASHPCKNLKILVRLVLPTGQGGRDFREPVADLFYQNFQNPARASRK